MVHNHQRVTIVGEILEVGGLEALIAFDRKMIRRGLDRRNVALCLLVDEVGVVGIHEVAVFAARLDDGCHRKLNLGVLAKLDIACTFVAQQEKGGDADDDDNENRHRDDKRRLLFLSSGVGRSRERIGGRSGLGLGRHGIGARRDIGSRICGHRNRRRNGRIGSIAPLSIPLSAHRNVSSITSSNRCTAVDTKTSAVAQLVPTFCTKHRNLPS